MDGLWSRDWKSLGTLDGEERKAFLRDLAAWSRQVDDFFRGEQLPRHPVRLMHRSPMWLRTLTRKDVPVDVACKVLDAAETGRHDIPREVLRHVPRAIATPMMVFASATVAGGLVPVLDMTNLDGTTLLAPMHIDVLVYGAYAANLVTSVYAKERTSSRGSLRRKWFVKQVKEGNAVYIDWGQVRAWEAATGFTLPRVPNPHSRLGLGKVLTRSELVHGMKGCCDTPVQRRGIAGASKEATSAGTTSKEATSAGTTSKEATSAGTASKEATSAGTMSKEATSARTTSAGTIFMETRSVGPTQGMSSRTSTGSSLETTMGTSVGTLGDGLSPGATGRGQDPAMPQARRRKRRGKRRKGPRGEAGIIAAQGTRDVGWGRPGIDEG
jgi:hypothetical protein